MVFTKKLKKKKILKTIQAFKCVFHKSIKKKKSMKRNIKMNEKHKSLLNTELNRLIHIERQKNEYMPSAYQGLEQSALFF